MRENVPSVPKSPIGVEPKETMEKFCVFCGERPKDKNKEHVLPLWLIALTGDPNRIANFGLDFPNRRVRQFAFDELTFPACSECNSEFAVLEAGAEQVVRKLLAHDAVNAYDLMLLLDWLDKVRVGLWLGYFYLDKNFAGIEPRFHIIQRLGSYDRMVGIIRLDEALQGLRFVGPMSKFYQLSPTCFALGINDLYFLNVSGVSLCSQRLGFPHLRAVNIRKDHQLEVSLHPGTERIMFPVERSETLPDMVCIYQPVFRQFLKSHNRREYLTGGWIKKHTADEERGLGKLFLQRDSSAQPFGEDARKDWFPLKIWKPWQVVGRLPEYVYGRLRQDFEKGIGLYESADDRKHQRMQANMARMLDNALLRRIGQAAKEMKRADSELSDQTPHR